MVDKVHTQKRILNTVELYKRMFPQEYKVACNGVIMQRQMLQDETASIKGEHSGASTQRQLLELPEKLYMSISNVLDGEELTYFKSKEGSRWFSKKVPEFCVAKI